jgi:hypothetical protein
MQANIFSLKEFDDWEAITPKTYPALKIFIGGVYTRCILAQQLRNTAGQMGCTTMNQNMYASLGDNDDDDTTATDNMITNVAALTTGSSTTAANTIHELVINTINQLNANQAALIQQMAAMLLTNHNRTLPPAQITVPQCNNSQSQRRYLTRAPRHNIHSAWNEEDKVDEEDELDKVTEQVAVEDATHARHLPTMYAIKHR